MPKRRERSPALFPSAEGWRAGVGGPPSGQLPCAADCRGEKRRRYLKMKKC